MTVAAVERNTDTHIHSAIQSLESFAKRPTVNQSFYWIRTHYLYVRKVVAKVPRLLQRCTRFYRVVLRRFISLTTNALAAVIK